MEGIEEGLGGGKVIDGTAIAKWVSPGLSLSTLTPILQHLCT